MGSSMSEGDYTSYPDKFLKDILELRHVINEIIDGREKLNVNFEKLQRIVNSISKELNKSS